jgi:hypothetical protein
MPAPNRALLVALGLCAANALLALGVMLSPFGRGEGYGVIGYSVLRALVFVLMLAIAVVTLRVVLAGQRRGEHGAFALLVAQAALLVGCYVLFFS